MVRYVLSIDGGGIRAIIPAMILAEIEKRAIKPIADMVDLVAGTSFGGLVAAAVCKRDDRLEYQYSARDVVELYRQKGPKIFHASYAAELESECCSSLYSADIIEGILHDFFGNDTLGNTPKNLMLTCYDMHIGQTMMFKSWKHKDVKFKDAVRASTAVPTYFHPKKLKVSQVERCLVDGGVFANNPAVCAYLSAKKLYPSEEIAILSISCGRKVERVHCDMTILWGKLAWANPLFEIQTNAASDLVRYQLEQFIGENFMRIDTLLEKSSFAIDDASEDNLKALTEDGEKAITSYDKLIDKFLDKVLNKRGF